MDDRYLYFALADPDYFDVPWAIDETRPVDLDEQLPAAWSRATEGPWQFFRAPGAQLPDCGWKIHVSMVSADAPRVLCEVARACVRHGICFKTLRGARLIRASHLKYAPASISGKVATIYPTSVAGSAAVVDDLVQRLRGTAAPTFPGEFNHPSAPLGVRWGSFVEHWVEAPDGRFVPGVRDDTEAGADIRTARRSLPPELACAFEVDTPGEPLPVASATVLHRSNAGGVYRATLRTGESVVLKEARHHTGLDANGVDAVTRLRHERAVLERLRGLAVAPGPVDYWQRADADFLVMEALDGPSLVTLVGRDHPRGRPDATASERSAFDAWATDMVEKLRSVVDRMHDAGVGHGDVQPGNIVAHAGDVRLVDFESACLDGTSVSVGLGTPGFVCGATDPAERDTFAVERVNLMLRDPDALLLDRRPDLQPHFDSADAGPLDPTTRRRWRERLAAGMLSRATPQRRDRLFPGGIEQFTVPLGGRSIASGAAGVLLTWQHLGRCVEQAHLDWLADLPSAAYDCRGLAEGIDGVAVALARLGRAEQASRIADGLVTGLPRGPSWARGRAGVAVALAELTTMLDRDDLRRAAIAACESVVRDVDDPAQTIPGPGLLHGWAGIGLALIRVDELLDLGLHDTAIAAVRRELAILEQRGDCLLSSAGGRLRSGLGHGSGAIVLALSALGTADEDLAEAKRLAGNTTERMTPPLGGLFDGVAGDAVVLDALGQNDRADERRERGTWYCVQTPRGWSMLGAQRLRCSDDVATGTSGLLLALADDPSGGLMSVMGLPCPRR